MKNENEIGFPMGNTSTIDSNEVNNNDLGTNDIVIDEITTISGPTEAHTFLGEARGEDEIAKILKDVNAVLTNLAVDDIKRLFTQQTSPIVFLTQLPHPIFCTYSSYNYTGNATVG